MHSIQPPSEDTHARILLVEDDAEISRILTAALSTAGFAVHAVGSATEMNRALEQEAFDLVVLDVMLPGEDGFSICSRLRTASSIPIIMVTALVEDVDRIVGLNLGADDYITKPFNSRVLIAHIGAVLRRTRGNDSRNDGIRLLRFAGWEINPASRLLQNPDGARVTMTSAEFDLLLAFCRNPQRVLAREQLLGLMHGGLAGPVQRSVDVHVSRVRQKIEVDPREPEMIKTVRLGGYIFTPDVEMP